MRKINFLVIAVFSILVILIVNAAEEKTNESYNQSNENKSFNTTALESNENLVNETSNSNLSSSQIILNNSLEINNTNISVYEESQYDINNEYNINNNSNKNSDDLINKNVSNKIVPTENEKQGKAVTASFGVYLEIVG